MQLREEFESYLYCVATDVSSGHSLAHALEHAGNSAKAEFGIDAPIVLHARQISTILQTPNFNICDALREWQKKTDVPEIALFAETCMLCVESGANLPAALRKVHRVLTNRLEAEREIQSMLAQKRLECNVLTAIPVALLLLLNFVSASYLTPLYETTQGRIWMTAAWMAMGGAYAWNRKITQTIFDIPASHSRSVFPFHSGTGNPISFKRRRKDKNVQSGNPR